MITIKHQVGGFIFYEYYNEQEMRLGEELCQKDQKRKERKKKRKTRRKIKNGN